MEEGKSLHSSTCHHHRTACHQGSSAASRSTLPYQTQDSHMRLSSRSCRRRRCHCSECRNPLRSCTVGLCSCTVRKRTEARCHSLGRWAQLHQQGKLQKYRCRLPAGRTSLWKHGKWCHWWRVGSCGSSPRSRRHRQSQW